jgi:serine/threonine protein phosphatase PrpC
MPIETGQHIIGYRSICQDAAGIFERRESTVLVVADGAGGIEDGEVASRSVIDAVRMACREATAIVDWTHVLRGADNAIASGQSTACVVELTDTALRGASVGDSRVGTLVGDDLEFPSDDQQRKPLLGTGEAMPKPFAMPWSGRPVIVGSDGLWNYIRMDRLLAELRFIDFPVLAKTLAEMVRLPSGGLADDVAVVCAHRRRISPAKRRIDLLAGEV